MSEQLWPGGLHPVTYPASACSSENPDKYHQTVRNSKVQAICLFMYLFGVVRHTEVYDNYTRMASVMMRENLSGPRRKGPTIHKLTDRPPTKPT